MELNWETAKNWLKKANEKKDIENEPRWGWDCNFKLDFDGPLLTVESRFYPPHKNNGNWWEGSLKIYFTGNEILKKEFKSKELEELKKEVEIFVNDYKASLEIKTFTKLNITSEVLDKLGFSEYWDEHCTWGGRTLSFSNGTNFRIVEQNEMEDGNEGYLNPPYYVSNHFYYSGFFAIPENEKGKTDLFFLHEMYDCIKENYPDCLQEFYDKCEAVYMAGYIDEYLKTK